MGALAELVEELVGEVVDLVVLLWVADGQEDLGDAGARLVSRLAQAGDGAVDLLVRDRRDEVEVLEDDLARRASR